MRKFCYIYLFLSLICLIPNSVSAASRTYIKDKCQQIFKDKYPKVKISFKYGELNINHELSHEEIENIKLKDDDKYEVFGRINGLTNSNPRFLTSVKIASLPVNDMLKAENIQDDQSEQYNDLTCFYPEEIRIKAEYDDVIMYIAKDIAVDTCLYNLTLRHEQTHLDIMHETMNLAVSEIKSKIKNIILEEGAHVSNNNYQQETSIFLETYISMIKPIFDFQIEEGQEQHKKIDTKENYMLESTLCP